MKLWDGKNSTLWVNNESKYSNRGLDFVQLFQSHPLVSIHDICHHSKLELKGNKEESDPKLSMTSYSYIWWS